MFCRIVLGFFDIFKRTEVDFKTTFWWENVIITIYLFQTAYPKRLMVLCFSKYRVPIRSVVRYMRDSDTDKINFKLKILGDKNVQTIFDFGQH